MKRILYVLIASALLLGGCGNKPGTSSSNTGGTNNNKESIEFNPVYVAIDDQYLKMEVTSVSKEVRDAGQPGECIDYKVNFTLTNKSDKYGASVNVYVGSSSIGPYTVEFANMDTDVRPGKINDVACFTCQSAKDPDKMISSDGVEHISSLEDLLAFNALVTVTICEQTDDACVVEERYKAEVSLENAPH